MDDDDLPFLHHREGTHLAHEAGLRLHLGHRLGHRHGRRHGHHLGLGLDLLDLLQVVSLASAAAPEVSKAAIDNDQRQLARGNALSRAVISNAYGNLPDSQRRSHQDCDPSLRNLGSGRKKLLEEVGVARLCQLDWKRPCWRSCLALVETLGGARWASVTVQIEWMG